MQAGMESCLTKSIMAGGMGFALGGAFGLFMSSVCLCYPYIHLRTICLIPIKCAARKSAPFFGVSNIVRC
jgi:hypothetical protein